jgi:hypothetical protein
MTSPASSHLPIDTSGWAWLVARTGPAVRDNPYCCASASPRLATSAALLCSPIPSSRCDSLMVAAITCW